MSFNRNSIPLVVTYYSVCGMELYGCCEPLIKLQCL